MLWNQNIEFLKRCLHLLTMAYRLTFCVPGDECRGNSWVQGPGARCTSCVAALFLRRSALLGGVAQHQGRQRSFHPKSMVWRCLTMFDGLTLQEKKNVEEAQHPEMTFLLLVSWCSWFSYKQWDSTDSMDSTAPFCHDVTMTWWSNSPMVSGGVDLALSSQIRAGQCHLATPVMRWWWQLSFDSESIRLSIRFIIWFSDILWILIILIQFGLGIKLIDRLTCITFQIISGYSHWCIVIHLWFLKSTRLHLQILLS